jgi:hypothetical protein
MPVNIHHGETLKNAAYRIEEHVFNNCKLTNCDLFYDGGSFGWTNTTFENCRWTFRGAARDTVQLLSTLGLIKAGQVPPPNIPGATAKMN